VETYSKADIDEYVEAFRQISKEAYSDPQQVKTAPHRAALGAHADDSALGDIHRLATTWRAYQKQHPQKP